MTGQTRIKKRKTIAALLLTAAILAIAAGSRMAAAQQQEVVDDGAQAAQQPAPEAPQPPQAPAAPPPPPFSQQQPPATPVMQAKPRPDMARPDMPKPDMARPDAPVPPPPPSPAGGIANKVDMSTRAEPLKSGEKVNIDFSDMDIKLVVKFIAEITGRNFVIDEKVKGKVTIVSPQPVTAAEAIRVLESTLEVHGYSLVEAGRVIKVVPAMDARQRGSFKPSAMMGDRMITRLFPLKYVKADDIVNVLRPLVPSYSFITAFGATNTVIIVDNASNVEKLAAILDQLDSQTHEEITAVIQLKYAGAKDLADKVEKIFKTRNVKSGGTAAPAAGQAAAGAQTATGGWSQAEVMVMADERINALIVIAAKPMMEQIQSLVDRLDVKPETGRGGVNVRYLKNADAENVAKVLNNMTLAQPATAQAGRQGAPSQALKLQDKVTITPDKITNSLVITASVDDYETLNQVIDKLDIRRKQVFVETLIMEVSSDKTRELGIEWRTTSNFTNTGVQGIGGTNYGNINTVAQNPLNAPQGLTVGVVDGLISFGGAEFLNIGALLHAMQSESGVNVLSTPNIMTTDNEEAEIIVAKNVPFQTSQSQTTGGNVVSTFERKNVGITLKIKPQISDSGEVRMAVYQEISSVLPTADQVAKDIMTFTRSVKTTVVVHDSQNIVIGGLMSDDLTDQETKIPFFGDVPLFGWLFKSAKKQKTKTNLIVFLTPHIITKAEDADAVTNSKRGKISVNTQLEGDFGSAVKEVKEPAAEKAAPVEKKLEEKKSGVKEKVEQPVPVAPAEKPAESAAGEVAAPEQPSPLDAEPAAPVQPEKPVDAPSGESQAPSPPPAPEPDGEVELVEPGNAGAPL
ncbi:MAG: type II secretion system secretin GspD [Nitrospinae bacterium]|nr:type II secretion system secretin GspD [Nitrospinota bacterium]